jgi:glycosyltransferase involved in cell wall biosynthesis
MALGVHLAPLPHFYGPSATIGDLPPLPPGKGPLVACLGETRPGKSGMPLSDIVTLALRRRQDFRFLFQVTGDEAGAPLDNIPQVRLVRGWLDDDTFIALIQAADMLLLPYKRHRYVERVSGPFAFAAAHGRPSIVPTGTWMAEQIARKQAVGVAYKQDAAVVDALVLAAERLPALHAQAAMLVQRWRRWDGTALLRIVREWAAGERISRLKCFDPLLPFAATKAKPA